MRITSSQSRSVVRAIRISRDLDNLLKEETREKRINLNAFIQSLLRKYFEWDRYAEKFKFVEIPSELFKALTDELDDRRNLELSRINGLLVKDAIQFWFKRVSLETFLEYSTLVFKYSLGNQAEYDFKTEGKNAVMTVRHQFGAKYSLGATELLRTAIKVCIGVDPQTETRNSQIVLRFTLP